MRLTRRSLLAVSLSSVALARAGTFTHAYAQATGGSSSVFPPLPDAIAAKAAIGRAPGETSNEPYLMIFESAEFATPTVASKSFGPVKTYITKAGKADLPTYESISVGVIGDQRYAMYSADNIHPWSLRILTRRGPTIFFFNAVGVSGEIEEYSVDFLTTFLSGVPKWTADSVIPAIEELPVGWTRLPEEGTIDVLSDVRAGATPAPE